MHDSCKYLNCASEEETGRDEREKGRMNMQRDTKWKSAATTWWRGENTPFFQFAIHWLEWVAATNVTRWMFAQKRECALNCFRSTIGMSKSIIPYWVLCVENGKKGTHTRARASLCEWLWCLYLRSLRISLGRCLLSHRSLGANGECLWFIIEPIWKRNVFLSRRKGKRKNCATNAVGKA